MTQKILNLSLQLTRRRRHKGRFYTVYKFIDLKHDYANTYVVRHFCEVLTKAVRRPATLGLPKRH